MKKALTKRHSILVQKSDSKFQTSTNFYELQELSKNSCSALSKHPEYFKMIITIYSENQKTMSR